MSMKVSQKGTDFSQNTRATLEKFMASELSDIVIHRDDIDKTCYEPHRVDIISENPLRELTMEVRCIK